MQRLSLTNLSEWENLKSINTRVNQAPSRPVARISLAAEHQLFCRGTLPLPSHHANCNSLVILIVILVLENLFFIVPLCFLYWYRTLWLPILLRPVIILYASIRSPFVLLFYVFQVSDSYCSIFDKPRLINLTSHASLPNHFVISVVLLCVRSKLSISCLKHGRQTCTQYNRCDLSSNLGPKQHKYYIKVPANYSWSNQYYIRFIALADTVLMALHCSRPTW